jgi:hypothetical protein
LTTNWSLEVRSRDRRRCVFWELAAFVAGGHEEKLSLLN